MRRKNNKLVWYVLAAVLLSAVLWVISRDVPLNVKRVEQPLENTFAG